MSLFKRPVWAAKAAASDNEDDNKDIFSHSERTYKTAIADSERRKKEEEEEKQKQKVKAERRSSGKRSSDEVKPEAPDSTPLKRRRINSADAAKLLGQVGLSGKLERERSASAGLEDEDEESASSTKRRPPRKAKAGNNFWNEPASTSSGSKGNAIDLGDSSEDEAEPAVSVERIKRLAPPIEEEIDEESDAELAAIVREARARRLQQMNHVSSTPETMGRGSAPGSGTGAYSDFGQQTPDHDPVVQLLVTSRIPNTNPLRVVRRLSQRLQEIRLAWCNKQGFSEEFTSKVYFVHCMRKVYDVTTCRSLGLYVDDYGAVTMRGSEGIDGAEKVHLEAVTDEIFAEIKAEQAIKSLKRSGHFGIEAASGAQGESAAKEEPQADNLIKLVLKAKGQSDFKLMVKPTTAFKKIANACRKTFHVADDQSLYLEFDGERLEADALVSSTDISDLDCVDVHIT